MTAGTTRDPVTVGPYRLVRKLGEGGMGVVHLATDPAGRTVALKVLRAHVANDDEARRRLTREVATLRRVRHPHVAEVLDADVAGAEPYLVTRFVPGRSLEEEVRSRGPLPAGHVARLGRTLAGALAAIHAAGVVHRDVKPANVMLVDDAPVLIDFGIAHVADESRITRTGLVMGTPGYLSPELIYGGAVTQATDWWAWGATLAFAATGRQPFGGGPIEVILEKVRRGQSDLDGVEPGLRDLLAATLTVDADRRPPAAELLRRLDDVIAGVTTAPSVVDAYGRPVAPPDAPTSRTAPPPPPAARQNGAGAPQNGGLPLDRTKRMPPPAAASGASVGQAGAAIPPYPGARRPAGQRPQPRPVAPHPAPPHASPPAAAGASGYPGHPPYPHQLPAGAPGGGPAYGRPAPPAYPYPAPSPQYGQGATYSAPGYPHPQAQPWAAPAAVADRTFTDRTVTDRDAGRGRRSRGAQQPPASQPWPPHGPQPPVQAGGHPARPDSARITGTLAAIAVALSAAAAVAPGAAVVTVFGLSVLARLVQRSSTGLQRRRQELGGPRSTDVAVTVAALPWRLVTSVVMSLVALILPALVATSTAFIVGSAAAQGATPTPTDAPALFAGMLAGAATAWWGPGGWSLRTGSRAVVRSVTRGRGGRIALVSLCLLLVVAAGMVVRSPAYAPDWAPFPPPATLLR